MEEAKQITFEDLARLSPEQRARLDHWLYIHGITFREYRQWLKELRDSPPQNRRGYYTRWCDGGDN